MKLINLFEDAVADFTYEELASKLIKDCTPYLKGIGYNIEDHIVWRGTKYQPDDVVTKVKRRTDRKPLDTPNKIHETANAYFTEHFKHPYRNGVFTTGRYSFAAKYSRLEPVLFFPIGNFSYLWAPKIPDFTAAILKKLDRNSTTTGLDDVEFSEQDIIAFLDDAKYQDTDLTSAIDSGNEMSFWADSYYIVDKMVLGIESNTFEATLDKAIAKLKK